MISKIEQDVTLCKVGDGTLYSGVLKDQKGSPRGIAFTKTPSEIAGGVVFQIDSVEGLTGFMLPIVALMEEWGKSGFLSGSNEELQTFFEGIEGLKETLEPFKPKAK